jgi:hypothetical protein
MAELTLSQEDIEELLTVLKVALSDSETAKRISRDLEMIDAIEEQRKRIRRWIQRLSQQIDSDKGSN